MSDLVKYAELELQRIQAENAAKEFEAEQKRSADLRSQAVSVLRGFLPKDKVWEIEALGPVTIEESYGSGGYHRGLELTVDGLTLGYAEIKYGYEEKKQDQLFLRHTCKECGAATWTRVNNLLDLAQGPGPCRACQRKEQERIKLALDSDSSSLAAHLKSVQVWYHRNAEGSYNSEERERTCMMIAYERWINGRPLLTDERV